MLKWRVSVITVYGSSSACRARDAEAALTLWRQCSQRSDTPAGRGVRHPRQLSRTCTQSTHLTVWRNWHLSKSPQALAASASCLWQDCGADVCGPHHGRQGATEPISQREAYTHPRARPFSTWMICIPAHLGKAHDAPGVCRGRRQCNAPGVCSCSRRRIIAPFPANSGLIRCLVPHGRSR